MSDLNKIILYLPNEQIVAYHFADEEGEYIKTEMGYKFKNLTTLMDAYKNYKQKSKNLREKKPKLKKKEINVSIYEYEKPHYVSLQKRKHDYEQEKREQDIDTIMEHATKVITREKAIKALNNNDDNVMNALMDIIYNYY
jgi:NACalpha-BTF3-like transcription factor